tara:strand:+ start:784 stop:1062 length:279 start_codon:yes stop_codon:yes gene_type:complete
MLIKLIEVQRGMRGGSSSLNEVYLNPHHIISVTEDVISRDRLLQEAVQLGLNEAVVFSKVTIQEGNQPRCLTIVGAPSEIYKKIRNKQVLRG